MNIRTLIPVTILLTLLTWSILSWPLPMHMTKAITLSAHGKQNDQITYMTPGDSLQLLYYFELVHSWISGKTPFFYNLYEFNTGYDEERYAPGGYYAPFSLFYSAVRTLTSQALSMNIAGILSLWLTLLATWFLLRRYTKDEWIVGLFSIFVLIFPYRWKALFDASPTGFAMMWIPILILGLDLAVRDGKIRGGIIASGVLMMVFLGGDSHVFFFSVLVTPAWCLLALLADSRLSIIPRERIFSIIRALMPVALALVLVVIAGSSKTQSLQKTNVETGRDIAEVMAFSPQASGFFAWQGPHISSQVYLGWTITILVISGIIAQAVLFIRNPRNYYRRSLFLWMLCIGLIIVAVLALGPNGLRSGGLFMLIRELIPPYAMIRQAGKIFCLMPTLLAIAGVLALTALIQAGTAKPWWRHFCMTIVAVPMIWEYTTLSTPDLTYLQERQPAYHAVAQDARTLNINPHAIVIPLWPGDTHYSSIYQHFSVLHRIRMVNGYTPAVPSDYYENIFLKYKSINQGYLSKGQIEFLLASGIRYIILHEDLYPEKVAPFPVTYALRHYLNHPQLRFLERGDSVWAFRLMDTKKEPLLQKSESYPHSSTTFFPARHWEMEWSSPENAVVLEDSSASNNQFVALFDDEASVTLARTDAPPAPGLRWMVRGRGHGTLAAESFTGNQQHDEKLLIVDNQEWHWMVFPVEVSTFSELSLRLRRLEGHIDLDSALLAAGNWSFLQPGESMAIPAASFFHAGYTDTEQSEVVFLKKYYGQRVVLYGPRMPMNPGIYNVKIIFSAEDEQGVEAGIVHVSSNAVVEGETAKLLSQAPSLRFRINLKNNLPFNMDLFFSGQKNLTLNQVEITRIE